jgi:predicted ATPase
MIVSYIRLKNWRNFKNAEVKLRDRMFLAGPNACGKSNFLDVFRFLRDIVKKGGGLEEAVDRRGGLKNIRFMGEKPPALVEIEIHLSCDIEKEPKWKYNVGIGQSDEIKTPPWINFEKVWKDGNLILDRSDSTEKYDSESLAQTHLEQLSVNKKFREIADFFKDISYLHLVPQLLREPKAFSRSEIPDDPYGKNLVEEIAQAEEEVRKTFLSQMPLMLRKAVPGLSRVKLEKDDTGKNHLYANYYSRRASHQAQQEDQFSDGTLRLIGLLWALWEGEGPILLEEPELSLNVGIVRTLAPLIYRLQKKRDPRQQVIMSTHSADLLSDGGIAPEEVIVMLPKSEGTEVKIASEIQEVRDLLEGGLNIAEAILPRTEPSDVSRIGMDE